MANETTPLSARTSVQSLDRAITIIETLGCSNGGMSVSALGAATGLHKSTVHRLLSVLKSHGYIKQNESGTYRLSFKICSLSRRVIDGIGIVGLARPYLRALCEIAQESIHFAIREGCHTVYLHREECFNTALRVVSNVGVYRPLHTTGLGKGMLAVLSDAEIAEYWQQTDTRQVTKNTIRDLDALLADIRETRYRGYAIDNEESNIGVRCMAVALPARAERDSVAISISGPRDRMWDDRIQELEPHLYRARDGILANLS